MNGVCSVFGSDQLQSETLILCESQFLPPSDSAWTHVSIEYTGACAHARGRPGLGSQSLLRGAYRQIYTPIIGTWDSGQQLGDTTKIWETPMSTYRNKCGVRRFLQGLVVGGLAWLELG